MCGCDRCEMALASRSKRIARFVDLAHAAPAQQRQNLVRPELEPRTHGHEGCGDYRRVRSCACHWNTGGASDSRYGSPVADSTADGIVPPSRCPHIAPPVANNDPDAVRNRMSGTNRSRWPGARKFIALAEERPALGVRVVLLDRTLQPFDGIAIATGQIEVVGLGD